jgi:hypothetical protein
MAGYLEEYGVADERRVRVIRRIVIAVGAVAVGFGVYLLLPILSILVPPLSPGWWHVRTFLSDLRRHDYQAAYHDFGCPAACSAYAFDDFMSDWGPQGRLAGAASGSIKKVRPCDDGHIVVIGWQGGHDQILWYHPKDRSLIFWPWSGCPARFAAPDQTVAP